LKRLAQFILPLRGKFCIHPAATRQILRFFISRLNCVARPKIFFPAVWELADGIRVL